MPHLVNDIFREAIAKPIKLNMVAASKVNAQHGKATARSEYESEAVAARKLTRLQMAVQAVRARQAEVRRSARLRQTPSRLRFRDVRRHSIQAVCSFCRHASDYAWARSDLKLMSLYHRFLQTSTTVCESLRKHAGRPSCRIVLKLIPDMHFADNLNHESRCKWLGLVKWGGPHRPHDLIVV